MESLLDCVTVEKLLLPHDRAGWCRHSLKQHLADVLFNPLNVDNLRSHIGEGGEMNTAELISQIAAEHGVAKEHAKKIVESAFAAITAAASAGEEVTLAGFGRFKLTDRPERQGRNPATGATITIAASKKLAFTAAKNVRDTLNAGRRQSAG